jgi:hypothetical protein
MKTVSLIFETSALREFTSFFASEAKSFNSSASRSTILRKVPKQDGTFPRSEFPRTLMELLVAGNEKLLEQTEE